MIEGHSRRWIAVAALLALTLLALGLRTWRLGTLPAGLHFDEAAHGLLVESTIFRGQTPVFFSSYTGHEALYHYSLAPVLATFGPTILALRLPAALWSVALVPVVFALAARPWGWRVALLAALACACGGWLQHVGRIGFRANTLPVVSALAILFLHRALEEQRRRLWIASGALFGLSLYTYLAVRALPLLAPPLLMYLAIWHRPLLRRSWRGMGWFLAALLLVAVPFGYHMLVVPSDFWERFGQIAVTRTEPASSALLEHTWATLLMWGVRGARDGFFNLPLRPVFPGVAALPFYAGVLLALWRWRQPFATLVLLWLLVMLLPTIGAADAPHWLRAIGAAPAACLLWGLGAGTGWEWLARRGGALRLVSATAVVLITGWWAQATYREYFEVWARRPELYYDYMGYATDAARAAATVPGDHTLLISEDYYRHATYLYLAPRSRSAQWFDARNAVVWPRSAPWTALVSASTPTTPDVEPLLQGARGTPFAPDGLFAFMRLDGDMVPPFEPPQSFAARFGNALELRGYDFDGAAKPGESLHLRLYLQPLAEQQRELRMFVHIEDERRVVLAQDDALGYDAREWQPGDQFISFHDLQLPPDLPPGPMHLVVGLYDAVSGERFSAVGEGAQGDYVELPLP